MTKRIVSYLFTIVVLLTGIMALLNWQNVVDWYVVQTTDVQPAAASLAPKLSLTSKAEFLYEASRPEVLPAEPFNQACSSVGREQSIVLGCYSAKRIYVYTVSDPQLAGVEEVTAAHELLHAVYDRMSDSERNNINTEVERVAKTITDKQFTDTVAQYQRSEPGEVDNELHSILGTEYASLSPDLESHYKAYFTDRQEIVRYSNQYQSIFRQSEAQQQAYEAQRQTLLAEINQLKSTLESLQSTLSNKQAELNALRSSNVSAYNSQVPAYNAVVAQYNNTVESLKQKISEYNQIIDQESQLSTAISELNQKLDSNYKTK